MNITILCGHPSSPYARDVLCALNARGISRVDVIAAEEQSQPRFWRALWNQHGWRLPQAVLQWGTRQLVSRVKSIWLYSPERANSLEAEVRTQGGRFLCVANLNGEACHRALREFGVDVIVLAGAPILRSPVLAIPRLGTINAHQGALPRFRGMNVIEWSILEGVLPTVSIHFVDSGVDTGDVILTSSIPLFPGDTLESVRLRASAQQPELLARTVNALCVGALPCRPQHREEGKQYFVMHPRIRAISERRLREYLEEPSGKRSQSFDRTHVNDPDQTISAALAKCAG